MMWLELLLDRTAGPEVFDRVFAGEAGAWSDPAVLDMLNKVKQLIDEKNGFIQASRRSPRTPTPIRPCSTPAGPR